MRLIDVRRLLMLLAALLVAGCAQQTEAVPRTFPLSAGSRAASALPHPCKLSDEPPQDSARPDTDPRLPTSFLPVQAYLCFDGQRDYGKDGIWQVLIAQRLTGDLPTLTAALRQPDQPASPSKAGVTYACSASLTIYPTLILVSADGRQIRPRAPVDSCDDHLPAVDDGIAALRHVTVDVIKLRQLQTAASIALQAEATAIGCSPTWKDGFAHGMVPAILSKGGPIVGAPRTVSLCRYAPMPDDEIGLSYVSGRRLTAAETARLFTAVARPGKKGGCSKPHSGDLLAFSGPHPVVQIELGGCSRVIRGEGGLESVGTVNVAEVARLLGH